ncbi:MULTISPECIES: hypothetical protein [Phyllobacterium]|jgi:hypothetical protein|uniref:hypothetical protein n=1 Tax=Phyllobacterium TaxID=28100 RepID=UPI001CBE3BDC|nr:hypothetical protein [Phyllobacterium calauticae]MBZ3695528.1 hypothetical protein [Phyllobacterium calauticae]
MSLTELNTGISAGTESSISAVSWGPIIAGAVAAVSITILLTLLGSGFGLTMVSPWSSEGASATSFAVSTAIGLIVIQWISSGVGGYLTGRLRTKWSGVHNDEVYFRDTAHGFMAWALSTLFVVAILGSAITSTISGGIKTVATVTSGATSAATTGAAKASTDTSPSYYVDSLLRPAAIRAGSAEGSESVTSQVSRILLNAAATGTLPSEDRAYLDQVVTARSGLSEADAKARVDAILSRIETAKTSAKEAADKARKVGATTAFMGAFSLLIGAFIACVAAALGGRQRDDEEELYRSNMRTANQ